MIFGSPLYLLCLFSLLIFRVWSHILLHAMLYTIQKLALIIKTFVRLDPINIDLLFYHQNILIWLYFGVVYLYSLYRTDWFWILFCWTFETKLLNRSTKQFDSSRKLNIKFYDSPSVFACVFFNNNRMIFLKSSCVSCVLKQD